jgi:exodeoxyribonuclease VII large subunit
MRARLRGSPGAESAHRDCQSAWGRCTLPTMLRWAEARPLTVTEITAMIKTSLEDGFPDVSVQGEISNYRPASSGHLYFTLKDRDSILSAVMFRGRAEGLRFTPADGILVRARGPISVYAKRGSYQLICESLERAGEGDILAMLEERKRRLGAEGLFDTARKRPLPLFPSRVAVVTSPTGAVIRDILRVLGRRSAGIDVVVLPTPVQGDEAEVKIAAQIQTANRFSLGDVIIVARGGGSLEDLLPFSSEAVVRAIAGSAIPVVSAVGHETDVTLADLAADVRAPTPSVAAEIVSASRVDLLERVRGFSSSMLGVVSQRLERARLLLAQFTAENLERSFRILAQPVSVRLDDAAASLAESLRRALESSRHRLTLASAELSSCSPYAILERGYAVVTEEATGRILTDPRAVDPGEIIRVRLARGGLSAAVKERYAGEKL